MKKRGISVQDFFVTDPIPEAASELVTQYLKSGQLFRYIEENSEVTKLEKEFAEHIGTRFALAVNSCSSAIFLSLVSVGVKPGDQVIMPAFTFGAVPSAIVHAGAIPILVEVGENYRVDLEDLRKKMNPRIKAIVISHMRGHTSDMDAIIKVCEEWGVPLVEDAAHSLGVRWNGKKIGSLGNVGCFSFQSYKLVNSGEGGILVTNDEDIIARAVIMSGAYEKNWQKHDCETNIFKKYENVLPLYNMRLNNLSAVIIRAQIPFIDQRGAEGQNKVNYFKSKLAECQFIAIPKVDEREQQAPDSIQFNLVDFTEIEATRFMGMVRERGVSLYVFGLHDGNARVFWNWKFIGNIPDLPKTRSMLMRACDVRVPLVFNEQKIDQVAQVILDTIYEVKK